ncbi:polysaccharide lyase family 8 protein [Lentinus tigrinus ALCF2SS1-7]|uniref:polysaccharide lyase family 8 protein n=1 Tax=Lentinus tigrinus ALCF2SS1-7 TaxID=1328758 RepID=UPI0011660CDA|nr:polysaccharide lyase family 8 protein [Lentinus tigrinus ALCF2SS1-7]
MLGLQCQRFASTLLPVVALALSAATSGAASVIPRARSSSDAALDDIQTITERRFATIVGAATGASSISSWLSTLQPDGTWPDLDYTAGCDAPTANWKAQKHWSRILTLAAAWHGGFKNAAQWVQSDEVRSALSSSMGFWFSNDFTIPACLDSGGDDACPCGTPGLWNTNWFANVIGVPTTVGEVCLLLGDSLTATELGNCTKMTGRSFATFDTGINGVSSITGANLQDIAGIGLDEGLLTKNATLVAAALGRVHADAVIQNAVKADGIRADGSFGQHTGIIYNGNYGKDYENSLFAFEIEAGATQFQAGDDARTALETLVDADQWMIYRNIFTNVLHWDFSVLGRLMTDPVIDDHSDADIKTNLTQIQVLGQLWDSDTLLDVFDNLSLNTTTSNSGNLVGNRVFYANDYAVQRGPGYVSTLRMYSKRTQNTECTDEANNFGFHLADGTVYTHINGDEYEDIVAAWDWNLIPGITVDYGATPLQCNMTRKTGTQPFVGGASDGKVGAVAMRYENPISKSLNWRKTWFFLENDVQFVMVARITSSTTAPVFSVLDQRKHVGDVLVNGEPAASGNFSHASTLWHGGVGYVFNVTDPVTLSVDVSSRTGDWSAIGASSQPPVTVDMFSAWLVHNDLTAAISYMVFPATTADTFQDKVAATDLHVIRNDGSISALVDNANKMVFGVFWETNGGQFTIPALASGGATIKVQSTGSSNIILRMDTWTVTVADPTQLLSTLTLTFTLSSGTAPPGWGSSKTKTVSFTLPSGGVAGSSLTQMLPA